jgi:transcriptional regulator with GAF, ATPase, and Fis domain
MNRRQWFASLFAAPAARIRPRPVNTGIKGWYSEPCPNCNPRELTREDIIIGLRKFDGNLVKAARYLGKGRRALAYRMEKYGIKV